MLLSQLRLLEPYGLDFHSDDLDDFSVEFALRSAREAAGRIWDRPLPSVRRRPIRV